MFDFGYKAFNNYVFFFLFSHFVETNRILTQLDCNLTMYKWTKKTAHENICMSMLVRPQPQTNKIYNLYKWICVFMLDNVFVCSVSLSSLDSEEQESLRAERLHNRSSRNSTGGISTHSLNEAELAVCIIKFVPFNAFLFLFFVYVNFWEKVLVWEHNTGF